MLGIEEITTGKDVYLFRSNFRFAQKVQETVDDPFVIYEKIANGSHDPELIKGVMIASIQRKNGSESFGNVEKEVEDLITKEGLQDCKHLALTLLTHAVIGDRKKSELYQVQKKANLVQQLTEPFRLMSFKNLQSSLVSALWISGISICMIFSLHAMHIV